ncbi:type II secretion system protein [Mucisphaera calidilacus]|uniref:Type II secretion system protein G n=1 Tax=Mucisphaera calidilacus TaxID=2527982 RepID=A0A518BT94_9BACT|nr:prepilin-type N-terminal cleavage/methylation domain-containing protein [Mucisphaera calidilacus]QDU70196.1 Type II secretion system protein G precursor [Mucisphaera calidilacus]
MGASQIKRRAFTLVEILIVVVILGILAAVVIPQFSDAAETAKASSLVSQLQTVRSQLELYMIQHNGNYPSLGSNWNQLTQTTSVSGATSGSDFGPYLQKSPINPFENSSSVDEGNNALGTAAAGVGWVYNPDNGQIKAVVNASKATTLSLSTEDVATYSSTE